MKKVIGLAILAALAPGSLWAQGVSTIKIGTSIGTPVGPLFYVDGRQYNNTQIFIWPTGSKHIIQFLMNVTSDGQVLGYQAGNNDTLRYTFGGWKTNGGLSLQLAQNPEQIVTASPDLTEMIAQITTQHKVHVQFYASAPGDGDCANALTNPSLDGRRYGVVYVDNTCIGDTKDLFLSEGVHPLNAYPFPGYVFTGWSFNGQQKDSYISSFTLTGSVSILPQFMPAKRVRFNSVPTGLKIIVDSSVIQLPPGPPRDVLPPQNIDNYCTPNYAKLPGGAPLGVAPLCIGDFDFLPGSVHRLGAPQSQTDDAGNWWVFQGFSNGLKQNDIYIPDGNVGVTETINVNFVPGVPTTILTSPAGLKLEVDGRQNWPNYNFMWGAGEKHTITALPTQTDTRGRRYRFTGWSNTGNASQEVTVPNDRFGITLTAKYQILGQLQVATDPAGLSVTVDGATCASPCTIDKDAGESAQVSIAKTVSRTVYSRYDFDTWNGGDTATSRTVTFNSDVQTLRASYHSSYLLVANSDPVNQVDFSFSPTSPDGFFAEGTQVTVKAAPKGGFKFRRWDGDLSGTFSTGYLNMSSPHEVIARLDKVPFIPSSGIKNAAGETPDGTVAPGSIISIYGENLADAVEVGPSNPLAQTLGGITVNINDRLLPLLFVSQKQINAQVPSDLEDGSYTLKIKSLTQPDVPGTINIRRNAPGVFTQSSSDTPLALAFHEDGTAVTAESPARRLETVTLYGTGFGPYERRVIDGFLAPTDSANRVTDLVTVLTGDLQLAPIWTGAAPGMVGTTLLRLKISDDMPAASTLELVVQVNRAQSNKVLLPVQ